MTVNIFEVLMVFGSLDTLPINKKFEGENPARLHQNKTK